MAKRAPSPPPPSVAPYYDARPAAMRELLLHARNFLLTEAPGLQEGMKWKLPFFMLPRNLFCLDAKGDHVELTFCQGAAMKEFHGVFDRVMKEIAVVNLRSTADLQKPGLRDAVRAAAGLKTKA